MTISGPLRRSSETPKRPTKTEADALRSGSTAQLGCAATDQASFPKTRGLHCPNCPTAIHSATKQRDNSIRRQCCGKFLLRSSTAQPVERTYRDARGLILMCMYCQRTRRIGTSDQWDWVETYAVQMPARVTHGICKQCLRAALSAASPSGNGTAKLVATPPCSRGEKLRPRELREIKGQSRILALRLWRKWRIPLGAPAVAWLVDGRLADELDSLSYEQILRLNQRLSEHLAADMESGGEAQC